MARYSVIRKQPEVAAVDLTELGVSGLKQFSGIVYEEFLQQLAGDKGRRVYQEMMANDATIGAVLFAIEMLARETPKRVEGDDEASRDLIDTALDDMSQSWDDLLAEILSSLGYGWSYHEIVYKRRQGRQRSPGESSQYDDGLIGWRKWPIRAQTTLDRWEFTDDGGLLGMWQMPPNMFMATRKNPKQGRIFIPIEKALLFRPNVSKGNPEGVSVLRRAYRSWWYKKRIEEIEAIGIERDLAGYPVVKLPAQVYADSTKLAEWKNVVSNIKRNEQMGTILPSDVFEGTTVPMYALELLTTAGERQIDTNAVLQRYAVSIAQTVLADFIHLGQNSVGSFALADSKTSLFSTAMNAILDSIAGVINTHAIPRLLALNAMEPEDMPHLEFDDIEYEDVVALADSIGKLTAAGMPIFPDPALENVLREKLDLPVMSEEEIVDREAQDEADQEMKDEQAQAQLEGMKQPPQAASAGKPPQPVRKE